MTPAPSPAASGPLTIERANTGFGITVTITSATDSVSVPTPSGNSAELRAIAIGERLRAERGQAHADMLLAAADQLDAAVLYAARTPPAVRTVPGASEVVP